MLYLYLSSGERSKGLSGFHCRGVEPLWRPRSRVAFDDKSHSSDSGYERFGGEVAGRRVVYTIEYRFHGAHLLVKD
jgi:hypothetical protein